MTAQTRVVHPPHSEITRFLRFAVVGTTGTVIDFAILTFLKQIVGLPTLPANTLSFTAGLINNFTWNRLWTYADARSAKPAWMQFGQFVVVSLIGVLISNALVLLLEAPLGALIGAPAFGYMPAKVAATAVVMVWNFSANRLWTFQPTSSASTRSD